MAPSFVLAQESGGGNPASLLIFLLIPVVMYFLMIRPQRKRMKEQAVLQSSIGVGDEVITNSGIYGFVTGVEGDRFWLEIDDDVQIRIARAAIQGKVRADAASDTVIDAASETPGEGVDPSDGTGRPDKSGKRSRGTDRSESADDADPS